MFLRQILTCFAFDTVYPLIFSKDICDLGKTKILSANKDNQISTIKWNQTNSQIARSLRRRTTYKEMSPEQKATLLQQRRAEYATRKHHSSEISTATCSTQPLLSRRLRSRFVDKLPCSFLMNLLLLKMVHAMQVLLHSFCVLKSR